MDDIKVGTVFRAVRMQRRLRQEDVARRARVSQSSISRIERGQFGTLSLDIVRAVGRVLEIRIDLLASWRGGDLDRVINARHSALHEHLAERLANAPAWISVAEVSYSIWGERGVIGRLAFHAQRRMLAVFEIKADLTDPAGLIAQVDRYRRLAPEIAKGQGWDVRAVSCWAILADTDTNRRRLAAHRELVRGAFPEDGRALTGWLRDPAERVDRLAFIAYPHQRTGTRSLPAAKPVRLVRPA